MVVQSGAQAVCDRKEMIKRVRRIIDDLDNAKVEAKCCCTDPKNPPPGTRVVQSQCLDGNPAVPRLVSQSKDKYIWIPPDADSRPILDSTMACHSATVANQFYEMHSGCKLDCSENGAGAVAQGQDGGAAPHSHWWNAARAAPGASGGSGPDYCENPTFEPPEPLGHMQWTNEPGGLCKHPQYCKAHCFDHTPQKDWARHY